MGVEGGVVSQTKIVLATPHSRYDDLEAALKRRPALQVLRIRERQALNLHGLRTFAPRYVFFPHWSWVVPSEIFDTFECVIFHMTDLPFGRGGSPLQNLIVRGIEQTMLTALRCTAEMDAGPVYQKRPLSTLGTAEEVYLRAASLMEGMIVDITEGRVQASAQVGEVVTFRRRSPSDGDIRGMTTLGRVHDMIRMLDADGYPKAFVEIGGFRFEFSRSSIKPDHIIADVKITHVAGDAPG